MRISTSTMYETGVAQLNSLQTKMARTQQQLATQRRMITAADDPIAAARALEVTQSKSVNTQFATNRDNARASLSQVDLRLGGVTSLIQDVQSLAVKAGNAVLSPADRESLAVELEGQIDDMLGLANSSDGTGSYLFAGYKSTTIPFVKTANGAAYQGDQGQRELQVSSSRKVAISDPGSAIFESNMTGNGTFATSALPANTGTGVVSSGSVSNAAALTGHKYEVSFAVSGGSTTYTILDKKTGLPPAGAPSPQPFTPGQAIEFDGMSFSMKGSPANGDKFNVDPSTRQSIFTTMQDLLATLRAPAGSAGQLSAFNNGLNKANENLDAALDNVLSVRASTGARMKELDTLDTAGEDLNIQYEDTLSNLQDLDLVAAITQFTQQQTTLEAAQKSFKALSGLSLFNYIG
jgi:flagellar hook-associated protein 3 FlgL